MKYHLFLVWIGSIFLVVDLYVIFLILRLKYKIKQMKNLMAAPKILESCGRYIDEVKNG